MPITSSPSTPVKSPTKILLLGDPGSRKTTLLLQFPGIHVYDCDGNLKGPESMIRKHINPNLSYSYDKIRFNDKDEPLSIDACFLRLLDKIKLSRTDAAYKPFKIFGLDSLSVVNELLVQHILKQQGKTAMKGMDMRDWGPFNSQALDMIIGGLEQTGRTTITTCHLRRIEETDPNNLAVKIIKGYEPAFQGRVGDNLAAFFTDVWWIEQRQASGGKWEQVIHTTPQPKLSILKNSLGIPGDITIKDDKAWAALEPYLKDKI